MNVDWAVAIAVFVLLVGWSFSYYTGFFQPDQQNMHDIVSSIQEKLVNYMSDDVYSVPAVFNSNTTETLVLYSEFPWNSSVRNSTRVYSGQTQLPCMFSGNRLYWQSEVQPGQNLFSIEFSTAETDLNCMDSLSTAGANQTTLWAEQKSQTLSSNLIIRMFTEGYEYVRSALLISQNFRLEINSTSNYWEFGPSSPLSSNVYARQFTAQVYETGEKADIQLLVWSNIPF